MDDMIMQFLPTCFRGDFDSLFGSDGSGRHLGAMMEAGVRCQEQADETSVVCDSAIVRCIKIIAFAREIKETFDGMKRRKNKLSPTNFKKISDLLNSSKMKDTVATAREMEGMADECEAKSRGMSNTMMRSMPPIDGENGNINNTSRANNEDDGLLALDENDEELVASEVLEGYKKDIEEVEEWTMVAKEMNLLTVVKQGKKLFPGLVDKLGICQGIFERCKSLCSTVSRLGQAMAVDEGSACCTYLQAGMAVMAALKDALKVVQLSAFITKLANLAHQLIQAMMKLLEAVWDKFRVFQVQFPAAKKLQNWVNGLQNPFKKKKPTRDS